MEEHVQPFHAGAQREVSGQIIAIARHLAASKSGEVGRVPNCQILKDPDKLIKNGFDYKNNSKIEQTLEDGLACFFMSLIVL